MWSKFPLVLDIFKILALCTKLGMIVLKWFLVKNHFKTDQRNLGVNTEEFSIFCYFGKTSGENMAKFK